MSTYLFPARSKQPGVVLLGITLLVGISLGCAWADDTSVPDRTVRQIGVMEKIIDKVLIDSPNFLVHGGDNARGLYIDEFGAVFTFEASLVGKWYDFQGIYKKFTDRFEMTTNDDGDKVFILHSGDKDDKKAQGDKEDEVLVGKKEGREDAEVYEAGKQEMIQTLIDYGETMSSLRNDQWLLIAAHLKGADYFKEMEISRLALKIKMKDLRDFASGKMSEDTAKTRVVVEEY